MNYLLQGRETEQRLSLLLGLTNVRSEPILRAMHYFYVNGMSEKLVVQFKDVTQSNFNRACSKLNKVVEIVELIKELDWHPPEDGYKRLNLLIKLTNIRSPYIQEALKKYYVEGEPDEKIVNKNVSQSNLNRARSIIAQLNQVIDEIKKIDWVNHSKSEK